MTLLSEPAAYWRLLLVKGATAALLLAGSFSHRAVALTKLTISEVELEATTSGSVAVEFQSDTPVAAVQMDVLFDPASYTAALATTGTQPENFRVDSRLVEPGRLRVVVGAPNNAALAGGTVFRVPLTATDEFATFFPVVLTDFALATANGTTVSGRIAPRVHLLNLTDGGRINGQSGVQLSVEAGATDGTVAKVEYYVSGVKIGESLTGPFSITWTPVGSGPFVIQAIAYDSNGLVTESREVPIVITNVGTEPVKALYAGRLTTMPFSLATAGFVQIATTVRGGFTAKLTLAGKTYSQKGQIAADGTATVQFRRGRDVPPLTLTLQQYATTLIDQIVGQVSDGTLTAGTFSGGTFVGEFTAERSLWLKRTNEPPQEGSYTVLLPAATDAATRQAPLGDGVGTVKVAPTGAIKATLILADGTKVTQGTFLSKGGLWPLFARLYKNTGVISGDITFADVADVSDFAGELDWFRPENSLAKSFPDGFTTSLSAVGSRYEAPVRGERVAGLSDADGNLHFTAADGGLTSVLAKNLTLSLQNRLAVTVVTGERLQLKLATSTGLLSGSFVHPDTAKKTTLRAVIFQKQELGFGFFPSGTFGGGITIERGPMAP